MATQAARRHAAAHAGAARTVEQRRALLLPGIARLHDDPQQRGLVRAGHEAVAQGSARGAGSPHDLPQPSRRINFKSALQDIHVPDSFLNGISMYKVGSNGRLEPVTFKLSKDRFIISILPRKIERVGGGSSLMRPSILSRKRSGACP